MEKKKKKLLIATDSFVPRWDGITRFLLEVIPGLSEEYDITVVAPDFKADSSGDQGDLIALEGINIIRLPVVNMNIADINFSWFHPIKLKKIMQDQDVLFSQTIGPIGMCAIKAAKKLKKPAIAFIHSVEWELAIRSIDKFKFLLNSFMKMVIRHFYKRTTLLLVPSLEVGELYKKNGVSTQYKVVHLGTDINKFKPTADKKEAKKAVDINSEFTVIGFSGRIGREKNLITLYRAFRRLEKKFPKLKLLVIGKGIKQLEEIFSSDRNIIAPGSVNNVVPYLQAMDIFVLPSLTETSSLATMEAMACGLPVITTPVGYVKDYIIEKENGMFFPFKNSLVLSLKIEMLLNDLVLRKELGQKARQTIVDKFNWDRTIKDIKEYLRYF